VLYAEPLAFYHNVDEARKMTFLPFSGISILMQVTVTDATTEYKSHDMAFLARHGRGCVWTLPYLRGTSSSFDLV